MYENIHLAIMPYSNSLHVLISRVHSAITKPKKLRSCHFDHSFLHPPKKYLITSEENARRKKTAHDRHFTIKEREREKISRPFLDHSPVPSLLGLFPISQSRALNRDVRIETGRQKGIVRYCYCSENEVSILLARFVTNSVSALEHLPGRIGGGKGQT